MLNTENYISERMKEYAMNIDEFKIDEEILDSDGSICTIKNKTLNSIEVKIVKKTLHGVDCLTWFDMKSFNKRFRKL